jgi:hypothetical protein
MLPRLSLVEIGPLALIEAVVSVKSVNGDMCELRTYRSASERECTCERYSTERRSEYVPVQLQLGGGERGPAVVVGSARSNGELSKVGSLQHPGELLHRMVKVKPV